jgi:hypothetical protein
LVPKRSSIDYRFVGSGILEKAVKILTT